MNGYIWNRKRVKGPITTTANPEASSNSTAELAAAAYSGLASTVP